jgi:hypothetical protein
MTTPSTRNFINALIKANYERMMAYENACQHNQNSALGNFLLAGAEESEDIVAVLMLMPEFAGYNLVSEEYFLPASKLFQSGFKLKSASYIFQCVCSMERSMQKCYKLVSGEIQNLPDHLKSLIQKQYKNLLNSKELLSKL